MRTCTDTFLWIVFLHLQVTFDLFPLGKATFLCAYDTNQTYLKRYFFNIFLKYITEKIFLHQSSVYISKKLFPKPLEYSYRALLWMIGDVTRKMELSLTIVYSCQPILTIFTASFIYNAEAALDLALYAISFVIPCKPCKFYKFSITCN